MGMLLHRVRGFRSEPRTSFPSGFQRHLSPCRIESSALGRVALPWASGGRSHWSGRWTDVR